MPGEEPAREVIAVVGMAGRFPGAASIEALWSLFAEGREGITTLADPNPPPGTPDPPPGPYVPRRGIVADVDRFDAGFFRMSPAEAALLDPQHRLLLEVGWEALEDACLGDCEGRALGVFVSTGISDYLLQNLLPNPRIMEQHGPLQLLLHNDKDTLATRLSYFLDVRGPSMTVQTGCSSSLVALHLACQSLRERECEAALVGGVSLALPQELGYFYSEELIHSRDGRCRAFDAEASGTVRGNGGCAVVIKRLADALAARDPIWAVIKGSAVNNDGREKVGFTAPSPRGQAAVIREAIARAHVAPETIELIEAHGTGTPLGDPVEAQAIKAAFRQVRFAPGKRCAIVASKPTLGHLDAAAGLTGLIKVCLSLTHELIPPVVHFHGLNPHINFDGTPFHVAAERSSWPRRDTPRRAGVSAFGIGGTNVHVIVEEAPSASPPPAPGPGPFLFTVSAASEPAFAMLCERYREHLATLAPAQLPSFAFSTRVGRKPFARRAAFLAGDLDQAIATLGCVRAVTVERRVRKLAVASAVATDTPESFVDRLRALGVDVTIASRADLRIELRDGGVEILGVGEALSLAYGDSPPRFELALVAALWERGTRVDWTVAGPILQRSRIPTHPFIRARHWVDPPTPEPLRAHEARGARPPPASAVQLGFEALRELILAQWCGLIGEPDLRAEDNVFEAGATSLMVGQFIANCRTRHGLSIRAVDCYRSPTSTELAATLVAASDSELDEVQPGDENSVGDEAFMEL